MKIIIPLDENNGAGSRVCEHFGSAPFFGVVQTEPAQVEIIVNPNMHHDHGQCTPADAFAETGADAVIVNGIGARAAARLQSLGIDIYMAAHAQTLAEAIERFSSGALQKVGPQTACEGHGCH
ncbi:MAG TPA: dinitrogenase iron-molybdenum cofactor biosynthesis protein [Chlorobaculum parvum]|uniref:Dinitrogenase iron-molybdenum cofactor biosynthesis protein n=1 Tax=Chlorobaculum parvum TaxID=274539 RepID=A0A7C5DCU0_9CHLB|nr:dinitrogenase iron-molybdenum cofactor biosynthesis protein [Chlorobaculum parvum]